MRPASTKPPPPPVGGSRHNGRVAQQEQLGGVLAHLRTEMADRFLQFHRESELRYLAWEQVRANIFHPTPYCLIQSLLSTENAVISVCDNSNVISSDIRYRTFSKYRYLI